jgi:hypothetical protein
VRSAEAETELLRIDGWSVSVKTTKDTLDGVLYALRDPDGALFFSPFTREELANVLPEVHAEIERMEAGGGRRVGKGGRPPLRLDQARAIEVLERLLIFKRLRQDAEQIKQEIERREKALFFNKQEDERHRREQRRRDRRARQYPSRPGDGALILPPEGLDWWKLRSKTEAAVNGDGGE